MFQTQQRIHSVHCHMVQTISGISAVICYNALEIFVWLYVSSKVNYSDLFSTQARLGKIRLTFGATDKLRIKERAMKVNSDVKACMQVLNNYTANFGKGL